MHRRRENDILGHDHRLGRPIGLNLPQKRKERKGTIWSCRRMHLNMIAGHAIHTKQKIPIPRLKTHSLKLGICQGIGCGTAGKGTTDLIFRPNMLLSLKT